MPLEGRALVRHQWAVVEEHGERSALDPTAGGSATPGRYLVRLERETLAEVDRLALANNATGRPRPGQVGWSDDGTRVAIPMMRTGEVILVDLEDMAIIDTFDVS